MRPQLVLQIQQIPRLLVERFWRGVSESVEPDAHLAFHPVQQRFHAVPAHQPFQHLPAGRAQHFGEVPADAQSAIVWQAVQLTLQRIRSSMVALWRSDALAYAECPPR